MAFSRRAFLAAGAAGGAALAFPQNAFSQAGVDAPRFVLVILRGGLDGLAAAPALGDPDFAAARGRLAPPASGDGAPLPLDDGFGLHPQLAAVHEMYRAGEALVLHAVNTDYRDRSHFDAQNALEIGMGQPFARDEGWLNLALGALPQNGRARETGVALAQQAPLVLRGPAAVSTWSPSRLPEPDGDTLARLMQLYQAVDPELASALADGQAANMMAAEAGATDMRGGGRGRQSMVPYAQAAAAFLRAPDGPTAAVIEVGGWDTHVNQGLAQGALGRALVSLNGGLAALKQGLGPVWSQTVVAVVTEFGRTVAPNGAGGTDHGSGAAAFLVGGAVAGGRVIADWPGLGQRALLDGRDLRPTLNLNAALRSVLADHLRVPARALNDTVFPGAASAPQVTGLIRA